MHFLLILTSFVLINNEKIRQIIVNEFVEFIGQNYEPLKMMRAIHVENFGGPEVLQLKFNLIVPPLTKTQVLVRVKCAGVNPVETYVREGQYSRLPDLPYIPGGKFRIPNT